MKKQFTVIAFTCQKNDERSIDVQAIHSLGSSFPAALVVHHVPLNISSAWQGTENELKKMKISFNHSILVVAGFYLIIDDHHSEDEGDIGASFHLDLILVCPCYESTKIAALLVRRSHFGVAL